MVWVTLTYREKPWLTLNRRTPNIDGRKHHPVQKDAHHHRCWCLAFVIATALTVGVVIGSAAFKVGSAPVSANSPTAEPLEAPAAVVPAPAAVVTQPPVVNKIGDAVVNFGVTLTVHSIGAMATVPTTSGAPITGEPGTQLYLIKTTFLNNTKVPVDLSCMSPLWLNIYDTNGRKLAPVFETYRIAGNPECNYQLVQGLSHEWNFVYNGVAGATLDKLTFLDTDARQAGDPAESTIALR